MPENTRNPLSSQQNRDQQQSSQTQNDEGVNEGVADDRGMGTDTSRRGFGGDRQSDELGNERDDSSILEDDAMIADDDDLGDTSGNNR